VLLTVANLDLPRSGSRFARLNNGTQRDPWRAT